MNITIDTETLGNTSNAPIVQLAAVKFTNTGEIKDKFNVFIDPESLAILGLKPDYATVLWWLKQEKETIKSVFEQEQKIDAVTALICFKDWIGNPKEYVFWSHATFDPPILTNHCKAAGIPDIIPFWLNRDIRTLMQLAGDFKLKREGKYHNALDDCLHQAKMVSTAFQKINF